MSMIDKKVQWCLRKAEKEGERHRGLKKINKDLTVANAHLVKAFRNLQVMNYLIEGGFSEWAMSASFYARYHCLLAILAVIGYESRNQECTFAAIEQLILQKKIKIELSDLHKIFLEEAKDKLEGNDLVHLREKYQYGLDTTVAEKEVQILRKETSEFIDKTRNAIKELE